MELPTPSMQSPTTVALNQILADLAELPESDQRTKAIAKVRKQLTDLKGEPA
jgi:hypothetical protein